MYDEKPTRRASSHPTRFWPVILIGVGILWLLGNLGVIGSANIAAVLQLWPLLLILVGIDLLFGRQSRAVSTLLGLLGVALVVVIALFGPQFGLGGDAQVKDHQFSVPIDNTASATVELDTAGAPVQISALSDSNNLFEADIRDSGNFRFNAQGTQNTTHITLGQSGLSFGWMFLFGDDATPRQWDVRLSPNVPLDLILDGGSGALQLDLDTLQLRMLRVDGGSGAVDIKLPATETEMTTAFDVGSGAWSLSVPDRAQIDLIFDDMGSGDVAITVAENLGVRLEVQDGGSGDAIAQGFQQESGDEDEGVWISDNYDNADYKFQITVRDMGSGDFTLQR